MDGRMKITKEELHKLIDGLDIEKINDDGSALVYVLRKCQKELTLHEKLINAGFKKFKKNKISVWKYDRGKIFVVQNGNDDEPMHVCVGINNNPDVTARFSIPIENHVKIFETIEFLTKWQAFSRKMERR
jgi:hypothetical protein